MARVKSKDSTLIDYEKTGHGRVVILVDGALGHREYMGGRPLAAELSKNFAVLTYDRRGRGDSTDTSPYAVEREIEDIDALITASGSPVCLYGFSSGAVLALKAAAKLGDKVSKLAVLEPPFNSDDAEAIREFERFSAQMLELLRADKRSEAVAFFLSDMLPPEVLEAMKQSPDWPVMEAVAPTLAYDIAVLGDGSVPLQSAAAVRAPVLVLDGGDSAAFKHEAAEALVKALPNARRMTLTGQMTGVPPEILAPVLEKFFA